jgi:hypothetical protein
MPETIMDGTGTSKLAKVDINNKLQVKAITEVENKFVNLEEEEAYLLYSDITPTGAGDVFLYFKNTDTKDLILNWYRIWSGASAEAIDIYTGMTGTPGGTTTLTPGNMNITSSNDATGEFYEGADITGLSGGTLLDRLRLSGDGNDVTSGYPGDIVIQSGGVLTLQALTGAIALEVTLSFYYKTRGA